MNRRGILKEHASTLNAAFHVADWLMIAFSGWVSHWIYLGSPDLPSHYSSAIGISLLIATWLFPRFSLYQAWRGVSVIDEMRSVALAWMAVLLTLIVFAFASKTAIEYSRAWLAIWGVLGGVSLITARVLLRAILRWLRKQGFNQRRVVIIGGSELGSEVASRLQAAPWMGLSICGYFNDDSSRNALTISGIPHKGGIDQLANFVADEDIDQVWIAVPLRDEDKVKKILHDLRHSTVDIRFVPDLFGMRLLNHSMTDVAGLPVINLSVTPMVGMNRLLKAIEDRFISALILLLISPIMLVVAVGVKLSSPGPVFYRQERMGWNGKSFMMLKFRSMPVDVEKNGVEWGGAGKSKQPTRFGAVLRRTSLDELPQFLNVLKGDMSIVGPRPERTVFVEKFKDEIPGYMKKHLVKAGITGWAQINGWRGDTDLNKRVEYDLYYIENWSLWLDLKIIFLTVFRGFVNKNAY